MNKLEVWDEAKLKLQFNGRIFVNTEGEHYKFWTVQEDEGGAYRSYWGRIGSSIRSTIIGGKSSANRKISEKLRKGYREI